jgi:cobalt-zinc-cadmium efflux system membrane fusion protein
MVHAVKKLCKLLRVRSRAAVICVGTLFAFALAIIGVVGFSQNWWHASSAANAAAPPASAPNTVRVGLEQMHQLELVKVGVCTFRQQKTAIGQIAFNEDASTNVFAPFSGRVTRIMARAGDEVKRGDPLFEIDSPEVVQSQTDLIAALHNRDRTKTALSTAQRQADRQTRLIRDKATSQREVDQAANDLAAAQSDYKTAEGTLNAARNRLRVIIGRDQEEVDRLERERVVNPLLIVQSPIDGTIIARKIGPGQFVRTDATEPVFSIADLSTMWLKAFVSEADIPFVKVGQEIEIRILALPNRPTKARISAIGAASDPVTRRIMVRSEIPNPDRILRAEMFATFKISVGDIEQSVGVPVPAIIREGEAARLWVEGEPRVFQLRNVKVGIEQNGCVQVQDGIKPDEVIVGRGAIFVDNEFHQ